MTRVRSRSSISRRHLRGAGTPPRAPRGFPHSWREGAERFTASASFFFPHRIKGTVPFVSAPSVALLGLILASGCEDVRHDYFPLEVGSSWTYRVISAGRVHGSESIDVVERVEYAWEKEGPEEGARTPNSRTERFRVREPADVAVWTKDEGGVFRILAGTVTTIIQYPPFIGFGWTDTAPGGGLVYCKVIGREAVQTPADRFFDCIVIEREARDSSSVVRQWVAPEVGLVKWRVERPGRPAVEWLLERYRTRYGSLGERE